MNTALAKPGVITVVLKTTATNFCEQTLAAIEGTPDGIRTHGLQIRRQLLSLLIPDDGAWTDWSEAQERQTAVRRPAGGSGMP